MKITQSLSAIGLCLSLPIAMADSAVVQNPANGHSYQRIDTTMSWKDARDHCDNLGGYLVTITSAQEQTFVDNNLVGTEPMWLGGTDEANEGTWQWVTGENFTFTNWAATDPNDSQVPGEEDFMTTFPGLGTWADAPNGGYPQFSILPVLACEWDVSLAVTIDYFSAIRNDMGQVEIKLITGSEKNMAKLGILRAPAILQNLSQIQVICDWDSASEAGSSGSAYACTDGEAPASVVYWPMDVEDNGKMNSYLEFMTTVR